MYKVLLYTVLLYPYPFMFMEKQQCLLGGGSIGTPIFHLMKTHRIYMYLCHTFENLMLALCKYQKWKEKVKITKNLGI